MKILAGMTTQNTSAESSKRKEFKTLIDKTLEVLASEVGKITGKKLTLYITRVTYENNRLIFSLDTIRNLASAQGIAPELEVWLTPRGILQVSAGARDIKSGDDVVFKHIGELNYSGVDPHDVYLDVKLSDLSDTLFWHPDSKQRDADINDAFYLFYKNTLFRILRKYSKDPSKPVAKNVITSNLTSANASLNALYQKRLRRSSGSLKKSDYLKSK